MNPRTRRSYVRTLGAVAIGGIAGCLGAYGSAADRESASPTDDSPDTPRPRTFTPAGPDRAQGEPVSVERTITDEPGYQDGIEYYPSNRTIRFVAARSGGEPVKFGSWTFEEWGRIETAEVGLERARQATAERLGTTQFGSGMGTPPDDAPMEAMVIWLHLSVNKDREGNITGTPTVAYSSLIDAAPRSVDVTLTMEGDTFSRSVPVFVSFTILQLV